MINVLKECNCFPPEIHVDTCRVIILSTLVNLHDGTQEPLMDKNKEKLKCSLSSSFPRF